MCLRQTKRSNKDGSDVMYFQITENVWSKGNKRSEVKVIHNFGRVDADSEERLHKLAESILKRLNGGATGEEADISGDDCKIQSAHSYGGIYALQPLWEKMGLKDSILDRLNRTKHSAPLERALFLMVANRCLAPSSKLYCFEHWAEESYFPEADKLQLHHFYRALDFLEKCKPDFEKAVFFKIADLFNTDVELIFYDTTSIHFEVDDEDEEGDDQLRVRGYSKNGRSDVPQVVIGLAMTRDGLPVRSWVFPGNTVDSSTVKQVKADLRGWNLTRCVFVGDAGLVSEENLREISLGGERYIVGNPLRRELEIREEVLTRKGRYAEIQTANGRDYLKVKEVLVGDGERARRYILCFNPWEAARQAQRRTQLLEDL